MIYPIQISISLVMFCIAPSWWADQDSTKDELLNNGSVNSSTAWQLGRGGSFDESAGFNNPGSIKLESNQIFGAGATQQIVLSPNHPRRLEFSAQVKTEQLKSYGYARLMVTMTGKNQPNVFKFGQYVQRETESQWQRISLVFDVPVGYERISVRANLQGIGTCWFDDLSLKESTNELTPAMFPRSPEHPYWDWIRNAGSEIPWLFDLAKARELSTQRQAPMLIYVRSVYSPYVRSEAGWKSAYETLRADGVASGSDGLQKDALFRTGVLSDEEVVSLIRSRFVPILHTYRFRTDFAKTIIADIKGEDAVTPALIVVAPNGQVLGRLHRIGVYSVDLIDHWLRDVLHQAGYHTQSKDVQQLFAEGELKQVLELTESDPCEYRVIRAKSLRRLGNPEAAAAELAGIDSPAATQERSKLFMRQGNWNEAATLLSQLDSNDQAAFQKGWCLHRMGDRAGAIEIWKNLVGDHTLGRRAALCLLPWQQPQLWLTVSERQWPRDIKLADQPEGSFHPFSPKKSVEQLLEMQQPKGSWGGNHSSTLWSEAFTAVAAEALLRWRDEIDDPDFRDRVEQSRVRAVEFLEGYTARPSFSITEIFSAPYVLDHMILLDRRDAAATLIEKINRLQNSDGSWSYRRDLTTSFNTAHVLVSFRAAVAAGFSVPEKSMTRGFAALKEMRSEDGYFPYAMPRSWGRWMTTAHGSIARDPLCEHALNLAGHSDQDLLQSALTRFLQRSHELRKPTKKFSSDFNPRGHGGYFFFYAHHHALLAACQLDDNDLKNRVLRHIQNEVLAAQEFDGTFMDHFMYGRSYGTAMALVILSRIRDELGRIEEMP